MTKKKRIIILALLGLLLVVSITIGISYAWWTSRVEQGSINKINSDCLKLQLVDETGAIQLEKAYPLTDTEASFLTPYQFKIENTCNTSVVYDVGLEILESENRLSSEYIAIEVNNGEKKLLNTLPEIEPSIKKEEEKGIEGRYIAHGELGGKESISYRIKVWMNEDVTIEDDAMNKTWKSKIVVNASLNQEIRLVDHIKNQEDTSIEVFEHAQTNQTTALTDYRYVGQNPNNYVCFGSTEETCPEENLYRIIGIVPTQSEVEGEYEERVKLIKVTPYTENESGFLENSNNTKNKRGYHWNRLGPNVWSTATLNVEVLNKIYWKNLGDYQNYVANSVWYLGASSYTQLNAYTVNDLYTNERSNTQGYSKGPVNIVSNIGLMYPSDYGYSLGKDYKEDSIYSNRSLYISNSWLYSSDYLEWTITPEKDFSYLSVITCNSSGFLEQRRTVHTEEPINVINVRPSFYLKSSVLFIKGIGSQEDPYRISL